MANDWGENVQNNFYKTFRLFSFRFFRLKFVILKCFYGATTLNIMTIRIKSVSNTALSIRDLLATISITTRCRTKLSIMSLNESVTI